MKEAYHTLEKCFIKVRITTSDGIILLVLLCFLRTLQHVRNIKVPYKNKLPQTIKEIVDLNESQVIQ